ncbi:hypothetical protein HXX76_008041 [Chlamydomonas incerta]|uniref:SGNH hydrolase-type esterase domain-containing protein n=1 Tax=Chlamydomonas incerta TaxID=51695 RepID=A0A835T8S9_CHLIN|nr:hypothetical protein HXX76_008041 [Chlamydomonas incerta]|eukprot:KAG2433670.1 hypothetical protein HXX76_008041 [Chlamydomonas incerta]
MPLPLPARRRRPWLLAPWYAALLPLLLPALLRRRGGIGVGATFNFEGLDSDYYRRSALRPELDWHWGEAFRGIAVHNQPLTSLLGELLGAHNYTLPRLALGRGLAYLGGAARLRRVVRHLLSRQSPPRSVKIGLIGGSISWGQAVRWRGEADWFSTLSRYMLAAFPAANITTRNGCTPGVPANYMILCLEQSVDPDVELVFVEFTVNNGHDPNNALYGNTVVLDMERLVRRILQLPGRPAVVLMHVPTQGMAQYPPGHPKNPKNELHRPYYQTTEDALTAVHSYYDVQSLSLRNALYGLAVEQREGFKWEQAFVDHHPGNQGHKMMADLAVYLLQATALQLVGHLPYGREDAEAVAAALPEPMYPGNVAPNTSMCLLGERFRELVVPESTAGFAYINEGTAEKPKPGYVANTTGAVLRLRLNTDRAGLAGPQRPAGGAKTPDADKQPVQIFFHHLRSYEHMGVAAFSCVAGCACAPTEVDGHHGEKVSQLYMVVLEVSQAPACDIEIKVLDRTSSGEHKFKVSGAVIAERAGRDAWWNNALMGAKKEAVFGIREHNGDVLQITYTKAGKVGGNDAWA